MEKSTAQIDELIKKEFDIIIPDQVLELIKPCVHLCYEKWNEINVGDLLFNRKIYNNADGNELFKYIIDLLKEDDYLEWAKILINFFVNLEQKDQRAYTTYWPGRSFYPVLLNYMLTPDAEPLFDYDNESHVFNNFFLLEPDNTDWSYIGEIIDTSDDACNIKSMIDYILNGITSKNIKILPHLRVIVLNTINILKDDFVDADCEMIWFKVELTKKINELEHLFKLETTL